MVKLAELEAVALEIMENVTFREQRHIMDCPYCKEHARKIARVIYQIDEVKKNSHLTGAPYHKEDLAGMGEDMPKLFPDKDDI